MVYDSLGSHQPQHGQKCNHELICWLCHKEQRNQLVPSKYSHPPTYREKKNHVNQTYYGDYSKMSI